MQGGIIIVIVLLECYNMSKQVNYDEILNNIKSQYNEHNFVTIQEYASRHNLTTMDILADIIDNKYDSAILLISADEECITQHTVLQFVKDSYSEIEGYVSAKQYAKIHNKSYGVLLRDIKEGKYKTARQNAVHRWFLKEDDEYDNGFTNLVSAKYYSEYHNIAYSKLLRDLAAGNYKTAIQDDTGHWHISLQDQYVSNQFGDIDLNEYVSMKEYAAIHNLNYQALSDDVRAGYYAEDVKRSGRFIFIRKKARCITGEEGSKSYILLRKYAEKNNVDYKILRADVVNGRYKTAKRINNKWYLKPQEKCISYRGMDNFLPARQYAKLHDISYEKLLNDIKSGIYTTTVQDGSMYLIDKNEPCKTTRIDERNTPPKDGYLSVSEYVAKYNVTRNEILYDVKAGIYETAKLINGRWYIKEDEPCKTYGDNYISLAAYAKLHNVSRSKLLEDVESGVYSTPVTKHNRWLIDINEPFKSVDKRKKENKEQIIISARQYSINHKLPYIKVLADMKAGNYATAFQNGNRWFIDSKESPKTKVRPYKRKKLTE